MEMERCPACGWPAPKGRPCPRGCDSAREAYAPAEPPAEAAPARTIRPDSRLAHRLAGPAGLGGYLILPIVGFFLTILWSAWSIVEYTLPLFRSSAWSGLTAPGHPGYHWLWQPLILVETFSTVVKVIVPIALLVLIFQRRRSARTYVIAFYAFCCVEAAIDAGAVLLVLVDWLRSAGFTTTADTLGTNALLTLAQVFVLALIWIPYFVRSRRVRNTFVNPRPVAQADPPPVITVEKAPRSGHGRLRSALAVVAVVVLAGACAFGLDMYGATTTESSANSLSGQAAHFVLQAKAAYVAGNLGQAASLYGHAIQADRSCEIAYYGEWNALVKQGAYAPALTLADETTLQFPTSRLAWFELGFAQEAQNDLTAAATSYTKCLQFPQQTVAGSAAPSDAAVHKRLDLVAYVVAISPPRVAIANAVNQVNTVLQGTTLDLTALNTATAQVDTVIGTNLATLQKITPPAYFAQFHSSMLSAYADIKAASDGLATAAAGNDAALLSAARSTFDDAVDRFNKNDRLGSSLMQSYYSQEQPTA